MNLKQKSIHVLKSLQLKNGGILATPLNGAYPYVYTRDAVMITKAFNHHGLHERSEKFYYFMKKVTNLKNYREVFQRYTPSGFPSVTRRNENDNEGLLLHGIYDTYLHNKKEIFLENMWQLIKETAQLLSSYMNNGLIKTSCSIHEFAPLEHGHEIWANATAVRGLRDATAMAHLLNHTTEEKTWQQKANIILRTMQKKLFNKKQNVYIKNARFPRTPDISQLAPFYFDIDNTPSRLKQTLDYVEKHLWHSELGGFRRFRKFEIVNDWHWYTGGSGSWITLTAWGARFYKQIKEPKKAKTCLHWIESIAKKYNGLLPEHIATKEEYDEWKKSEIEFNTRIINETKKSEKSMQTLNKQTVIPWATPLGWSHAEYLLLK